MSSDNSSGWNTYPGTRPGHRDVSSSLVAQMDAADVVVVVDDAHNERPTNGTVLLSHQRADCQREYCRTVMGLFEETRGERNWRALWEEGRGKKKKII